MMLIREDRIAARACRRCSAAYQPTSRTQRYCPPCIEVVKGENLRRWQAQSKRRKKS